MSLVANPVNAIPVAIGEMVVNDLDSVFVPLIAGRIITVTFYGAMDSPDAESVVVTRIDKVRSLFTGEYSYDAQDEAFNFCFQDRLEDEAFWTNFESLVQRLAPIFLGTN